MVPMLRALLLTPLLLAVAPAGGDDGAVRELRLAFRGAANAIERCPRRLASIPPVAALGTVEAARALLDAYAQVEEEVLAREVERRGYLDAHRRDVKRFEKREDLDPLLDVRESLRVALLALEDPDAVHATVERALDDDRFPYSMRAALAGRAGVAGSVDRLGRRFKKAKRAPELALLLVAARELGPAARGAGLSVIAALSHAEPVVRELAADALAELALPASLVPLIDALERSGGETGDRAQDRAVRALQVLTGQAIGASGDAWRRWLEKEGGPFLAGEAELGGSEPSEPASPASARYHGIPLDGRRIVFLIDNSLSMKAPVDKEDPSAGTRLKHAKTQLIAALGDLLPHQSFSIVAFAGHLEPFRLELVPASAENVMAAQRWVEYLEMNLGTRTYDVLDYAFQLGGRGAEDAFHSSTIDTLFLLTDGLPIVGGKRDKGERIRALVRNRNLFGRVVLHTIGLGKKTPKQLLRRLAKDNGGTSAFEPAE